MGISGVQDLSQFLADACVGSRDENPGEQPVCPIPVNTVCAAPRAHLARQIRKIVLLDVWFAWEDLLDEADEGGGKARDVLARTLCVLGFGKVVLRRR